MDTFSAHGNWYIKPIELSKVDEYLSDLYNISLANTGFMHAWDSNLFFDEAIQLIANAIKLFQLGYFDCAFYSLRQSIETSIGTIYLTENPEKKSNWDDLQSGFESGTMSSELKSKETAFKDIVQKMPRFFDNIRNLEKGDALTIKTYFNTLTYEVVSYKEIGPTDTNDLFIQKEKDMLTLVTCSQWGTKRYMVQCERII